MTELRPTKTRVALLQAIADGAVAEYYVNWSQSDAMWDHGLDYQKVTARVAELRKVGWVRLGLGRSAEPGWSKYPRLFELTPAGEEILRQNGGTP